MMSQNDKNNNNGNSISFRNDEKVHEANEEKFLLMEKMKFETFSSSISSSLLLKQQRRLNRK
jgi:hypothetical protein